MCNSLYTIVHNYKKKKNSVSKNRDDGDDCFGVFKLCADSPF